MDTGTCVTADELAAMGRRAFGYELVRGRVVPMNPTSLDHARIAALIAARLVQFVEANALGIVLVEAGFKVTAAPDSVRGPDVSFLRNGARTASLSHGFIAGAPELAVEVRSPGDTMPELLAKAAEYLAAGAELVWIVEPEARAARVLTPGGRVVLLGEGDTLDGGTTLPGFALPLGDLFAR